jgi:hypothetical protein
MTYKTYKTIKAVLRTAGPLLLAVVACWLAYGLGVELAGGPP